MVDCISQARISSQKRDKSIRERVSCGETQLGTLRKVTNLKTLQQRSWTRDRDLSSPGTPDFYLRDIPGPSLALFFFKKSSQVFWLIFSKKLANFFGFNFSKKLVIFSGLIFSKIDNSSQSKPLSRALSSFCRIIYH